MRVAAILAVTVLVLQGVSAYAEDEKPPMDIAIFPGAEVTMEMNLTSEDIMPMLQAMLPLMGDSYGGLAKAVSPDEIAGLLKDIRRVEALQVEVRKSSVTLDEIASFYGKNLPEGQWRRVFYSSDGKSGLAIYADPASQSYYGFRTRSKADGSKTIKEALAAKVVGSIDLRQVLALAAKLAQMRLQKAG